ncbi:MAG: hypothetical protein C4560_14080 [Nitrospiraceae bacterium]|nr:MAG: hypothetical protein C4560_14080 [Nitrospiraceae bacterium]
MRKNSRLLIFIFLSVIFNFASLTDSYARVYIDITSPAIRKLPLSISVTGPVEAKEIEGTVKNDLEFTGIFSFVDQDVPGAEVTAHLEVSVSDEVTVLWSVTDLIENKEVFRKKYSSSPKSVRAIAHSISNDIYNIITGKDGIFRTKISCLIHSGAGSRGLYLMDWDGFNPIKIVSAGLTSSHTWSDDGRFLIYSSERNRQWSIYRFDLEDFGETPLYSSPGLNLAGSVSRNTVAFSSSRDGSAEIYIMDTDGRNVKKLTKSFGIDISPVFSPDGAKIAFVSDRGGTPQIYIMDPDGSNARRITFEGSYNTSPAWSPDGNWLAFVGRKDGKNQVFMIKFDATGLRQLTFAGNNESPSFSPDGMFLAFDSDRDGQTGIFVIRINGEEARRITPKNTRATSPRWSPDIK